MLSPIRILITHEGQVGAVGFVGARSLGDGDPGKLALPA